MFTSGNTYMVTNKFFGWLGAGFPIGVDLSESAWLIVCGRYFVGWNRE